MSIKGLVEEGQEVIITALPLYHIFALTANCLTFAQYGAKNVLIQFYLRQEFQPQSKSIMQLFISQKDINEVSEHRQDHGFGNYEQTIQFQDAAIVHDELGMWEDAGRFRILAQQSASI